MSYVKILVPVSGGKDSQACLKLAVDQHGRDAVRGLFCDTQFEHPLTYQHVQWMAANYGVRIDTVSAGSVVDQCLKHRRFPSDVVRFCTEELKIWPTKRYCKQLAGAQGQGFEVWYGMRHGESIARATRYAGKVSDELYAPHEVLAKYPQYLARMGVMFRLSIINWSDVDVVDFVGREYLNPLYRAGFKRVGCFPCLASGDKWKEKAFHHDAFGAAQHSQVIQVSAQIGKIVWTSKGGQARNDDRQGCLFCAY